MKRIKSFLLRILGQSAYLKVTSKIFFVLFKNELLTNNPAYDTHYFVKNFIKRGDTVIDIGANLGYYSVQFAKLIGVQGKVYSVEPIELYRKILQDNVGGFSQVTILPFALGEAEGTITMGNPSDDKHRHGLMRVLSDKERRDGQAVYEVAMKNPLELFAAIPKIAYIKCDIEGYEVPVIPTMEPLIRKHQPIMQIETDGDNKHIIFKLLTKLDYRLFYIQGTRLVAYTDPNKPLPADLIGIPGSQTISYKHLFN